MNEIELYIHQKLKTYKTPFKLKFEMPFRNDRQLDSIERAISQRNRKEFTISSPVFTDITKHTEDVNLPTSTMSVREVPFA